MLDWKTAGWRKAVKYARAFISSNRDRTSSLKLINQCPFSRSISALTHKIIIRLSAETPFKTELVLSVWERHSITVSSLIPTPIMDASNNDTLFDFSQVLEPADYASLPSLDFDPSTLQSLADATNGSSLSAPQANMQALGYPEMTGNGCQVSASDSSNEDLKR